MIPDGDHVISFDETCHFGDTDEKGQLILLGFPYVLALGYVESRVNASNSSL